MGLSAVLTRLAEGAPVPVFPFIGEGAREAVQDLRLEPRLRLVDSPRSANVLLAAGAFCGPLLRPALRIHDQLSHPRCTVWWPLGALTGRLAAVCPGLVTAAPGTDIVQAILRSHTALLRGERPSDPPILPDVPPAPWRGVGPYGQGGKGMTGGVPYGRPLAGRAPARDGLELDQLPVRFGPFFPPFPPGLILDVKLQGDVLQEVTVGQIPFRGRGTGTVEYTSALAPFCAALRGPVPVATIELARARHHLRWLAEMLRVHGLTALGQRTLRLSTRLAPERVSEVRALAATLRRWHALTPATSGVCVVRAPDLASHGVTGPVARASGLATDARADDPAYRRLGFQPLMQGAGDAQARVSQRLAEAVQALDLTARAGDACTERTDAVESPWGRLTADRSPVVPVLALLPSLLIGQEWGDAITTTISLDLDLEAALASQAVAQAA